jgi:hypothetical protein
VLGVTAVLAWSQAQHSAPSASPAVAVVKAGTAGTSQVVALPAAAPHATTHTS